MNLVMAQQDLVASDKEQLKALQRDLDEKIRCEDVMRSISSDSGDVEVPEERHHKLGEVENPEMNPTEIAADKVQQQQSTRGQKMEEILRLQAEVGASKLS